MTYRNRWFHWVCKDCEVWNHNSRKCCLGCEKLRNLVEIKDLKKLNEIYYNHYGRQIKQNSRFAE